MGKTFEIPGNAVSPDEVTLRQLSTGDFIPAIGLGTFGSDHVSHERVARAVLGAASVGYRHFDCAAVYGNEKHVGKSFKQILDVIPREELFVTSKLWNDKHAVDDVIPACKQSLDDLQLEYLDLYLVHWPFPNTHPPGCNGSTRNPDAKPYFHENYMKTWRQMEKLVDMGLVRNIGTSNMTMPKMQLLLRDAIIKPVANEMELHPHFQQPEFFEYLSSRDIISIGYSPIGSPSRPERDRTPEDTVPTKDPVVVAIAKKLGVHPAVVCIKWAIQRGQVPIPFSVNHYLENIKGAVSPPMSDEDMEAIASIDKNCRLIKGQVFLWKDGQSWEDLWDVDGTITPP
ncbi:aldo/keto reductase [Candidatus Bathyarchaeota archaeon]|nr:aldo/keto reductase [Candidatus Bathyarchaeota archaeon]